MWELIKEVDGGVGSRSVGLHLKSVLTDKLFISSKKWLTVGGAVPPGSRRTF